MQPINSLAERFHSLHDPKHPLALSNAWDVASAIIAEQAGATAVATTSAGIAWSLGAQDGDHLDRDQAVAAIARIAAAVRVPVTADIEGGFAEAEGGIAQSIAMVLDAGAVGVNIEDGSLAAEEFAKRIAAARDAADRAGVNLFINARTDVFLRGEGTEEQQTGEVLTRAASYLAAGANGIFVPGARSATAIAALVDGVPAPVNVMVGAGALPVHELRDLGVARVSLGSDVAQAAYAVAQRAATELLTVGTYDALAGGFAYGTLNELLAPKPRA